MKTRTPEAIKAEIAAIQAERDANTKDYYALCKQGMWRGIVGELAAKEDGRLWAKQFELRKELREIERGQKSSKQAR